MKIKQIVHEDFTNYKKASLFLGVRDCDGKCWKDLGLPPDTCQNEPLYKSPVIDVDDDELIQDYLNNPITSAVVIGGLEPLMHPDEIMHFITTLREHYHCDDDIVIYTGYNEDEVQDFIEDASRYKNIYVKFGRYVPNDESKFDKVLGVTLASKNQYCRSISALTYDEIKSYPYPLIDLRILWEAYTITMEGNICDIKHGNKLVPREVCYINENPRYFISLRDKDDTHDVKFQLDTLLAQKFLQLPDGSCPNDQTFEEYEIGYVDGDWKNVEVTNLKWVKIEN